MRHSLRGAISFALRFSFFSAFLLGFALFLGRYFFPPEAISAGADEAVRFTVTDLMHDELFDFPLSVKIKVDDTWQYAAAYQNGVYREAKVI